jgi:excisionase family DNA binding protein
MTTPNLQLPCFTIRDAEELLRCSRSTINRMVHTGKLIKFDLGDNSVRITGDSLRTFLSRSMMGSQMGSQA